MPADLPTAPRTLGPRTFVVLALVSLARLWWIESHPTVPNPNEMSRLYLTRAIVDNGRLSVDAQVRQFGRIEDYSERNDHLYSDKAPGLSFLGVVPYAALRAFGLKPSLSATRNLLWVTGVALPSCLFLLVAALALARFGLGDADNALLVLAMGLGTPHGAYAMLLFGHALAGALVLVAFVAVLWVRRFEKRTPMLVLAGAAAGYAVSVEYPAAVPALCVALYAASLGWRKLLVFLLAALPALALLAWYHTRAFGSPFATGYHAIGGGWAAAHAHGLAGVSWPKVEALWGLSFSARRGLFFYSPWTLAALPGFYFLWKRGWRAEAVTALAALLGSFYVAASFAVWWGGSAFGPRHVVVGVPFVLFAAAGLRMEVGNRGFRWLFGSLVCASVLLTLGTAVPWPYPASRCDNPWASIGLPFWKAAALPFSLAEWLGFLPVVAACLFAAIVLAACVTALWGEGEQPRWQRLGSTLGMILLAVALAGAASMTPVSRHQQVACDTVHVETVVRAR